MGGGGHNGGGAPICGYGPAEGRRAVYGGGGRRPGSAPSGQRGRNKTEIPAIPRARKQRLTAAAARGGGGNRGLLKGAGGHRFGFVSSQ